MTTILIRADGQLMMEERDFERLPPSPDEFHPLKRLIGTVTFIHRGWKDLDYHGDFRFYGHESIHVEDGYVPHFYVARFTHGTLEYIKYEKEIS